MVLFLHRLEEALTATRLPRDLSGDELVTALERVGLAPVRQSGSHIRLTGILRGAEVHVTVPRHRALRVGTLSSILGEVADHLGIERDALVADLFG